MDGRLSLGRRVLVPYAAAGIAHYDGTYVYALDAITGEVKWCNDSSGSLSEQVDCGVSLQGELYIADGELRFLGGGKYEIARYDLSGSGSHTAQIMAKLIRSGNGWAMTAIGATCSGRTRYQPCLGLGPRSTYGRFDDQSATGWPQEQRRRLWMPP